MFLALFFFGAYIIRILEYENPLFDFKNYFDSLWFVVVTSFTIGYGDMYPFSIFGRFFAITVAIIGIIISNLSTANL